MLETPSTEAAAATQEASHIANIQIDSTSVTLLGTAHVSRKSAEEVHELINTDSYDVVAVELCESRHQALSDPDQLAKMDLMQVMRQGKASMVIANLAMGAYQQRLAEQFGIEPGAEMLAAMQGSEEKDLPLVLIDREIGTTLKRTADNLPWWKRWTLMSGLMLSLVSKDDVEEDEIESLKQGDMLESTFAEFAHDRKDLYQPLIAERDTYMAARLLQAAHNHPGKKILAVLGAGHLKGIQNEIKSIEDADKTIEKLDQLPKKSRLPKLLSWAIVILILAGFYLGFSRSSELGWQLIFDWVLINGTLSAIGALLATAHPGTILTAFLAAPLTSLNPTIGAGMVTGAAELILRKPQVGDFAELKHATSHLRGWWRNRVSRTLLVFLFSTIGSAIGTYVAGFRIIERLAS